MHLYTCALLLPDSDASIISGVLGVHPGSYVNGALLVASVMSGGMAPRFVPLERAVNQTLEGS